MPRRKNIISSDRENSIQEAVQGYNDGTYPSIRSVAAAYDILHNVLDRVIDHDLVVDHMIAL